MLFRRAAFICFILAALSLLALPAAAQTAPPNDNFVTATALTTIGGKPLKIPNIHLASTEVGEPGGCPGGYTVWFKFNLPFTGALSLSTSGSYVSTSTGDFIPDTTIAIYTGATLGTLSEQACNDDLASVYGEIQSFTFTANTTYYVRLGLLMPTPSAGSYYLLTTRLRVVNNWALAGNPSFETPTLSPWTLTNKSGADGIACGGGSSHGSCAFKFTNKKKENSILQQAIKWPKLVKPQANALLVMQSDVANDQVLSPKITVSLTIQYSDGTPATTVKQAVMNLAPTFEIVTLAVNFASPNVKKLKIKVQNKSTTGSFLFDNVNFYYFAGALRDDASAAPLPLPPAPAQ